MANFFDENDIVSEAPQKSSFFDEGDVISDEPAREVAGKEVEPNKVGMARAALVGAGSGATGGFAEELTAPVVAAAGMTKSAFDKSLPTLPGESTLEKFQRLMQTYRDVAREEQKAAQEEHPVAYTGGAIAGGLATTALLPALPKATTGVGKIAKGTTEGAVLGGIYGAGEAEGGIQERLPEAAKGAVVGGLVGGAVPLTIEGAKSVGRLGKSIGEVPIVADAMANLKEGFKGQSLFTSEARRGLSKEGLEKSGQLFDDIKALQTEVGTAIGSKIDEATAAGKQVDLTDEVNGVLKNLETIKAEGSKEAASYASGVESEIKKVLGLKTPKISDDLKAMAPEGLNLETSASKVEQILVDPKKAQDLKQVLSEYTPKKGLTKPQEVAPAGQAKELRSAASEKLDKVTGVNQPQSRPLPEGVAGPAELAPSLNEQYGLLKDALKRLGVNERRLPTQIKAKLNQVVGRLEKENVSGDQARFMVEEVLENIRQVSPEVADKYAQSLPELARKIDLAEKNIRGGQTQGLLGTARAGVTTAANIVGLGANKVANLPGIKQVGQAVGGAAKTTKNFTEAVLESPKAGQAVTIGTMANIKPEMEPYKVQRQVANASENAEPEVLKEQATEIRSKYGTKGEQLATILDNMAGKDKNARRALMYTVLQNPAHRQMLGLMQEEKK